MNFEELMGVAQVFTVVFSLCMIILFYILTSLGYMKCLEKAGEEKWKGWIPFYSDIVMYKTVGLTPWLATVGIIKSALALIVAVVSIISIGDMGKDMDEAYEKELNKINSGSYYGYNKYDSEIEKAAKKYTKKNMGGLYVLDSIETLFSIAALIVNIFFAIYIAKAFGLSGGYIAGMILVPHIFLLIIGFGKSEYQGRYSMSSGTVQK